MNCDDGAVLREEIVKDGLQAGVAAEKEEIAEDGQGRRARREAAPLRGAEEGGHPYAEEEREEDDAPRLHFDHRRAVKRSGEDLSFLSFGGSKRFVGNGAFRFCDVQSGPT